MPTLEVPANPVDRCKAFLRAYVDAPRGADVEIRAGHVEGGDRALIIGIGKDLHGFTLSEAEKLAAVFDDGIREFGRGTHTEGFEQVARAIRQSIRKLQSH